MNMSHAMAPNGPSVGVRKGPRVPGNPSTYCFPPIAAASPVLQPVDLALSYLSAVKSLSRDKLKTTVTGVRLDVRLEQIRQMSVRNANTSCWSVHSSTDHRCRAAGGTAC
jgi:hypothetical protein